VVSQRRSIDRGRGHDLNLVVVALLETSRHQGGAGPLVVVQGLGLVGRIGAVERDPAQITAPWQPDAAIAIDADLHCHGGGLVLAGAAGLDIGSCPDELGGIRRNVVDHAVIGVESGKPQAGSFWKTVDGELRNQLLIDFEIAVAHQRARVVAQIQRWLNEPPQHHTVRAGDHRRYHHGDPCRNSQHQCG